MKQKPLILVAAIIVVVAALGFWYWQKSRSAPQVASQPTSQPTSQPQIDQKTADVSLGSQALQQTQNPAKDKLPETNPFQGAYTNPF